MKYSQIKQSPWYRQGGLLALLMAACSSNTIAQTVFLHAGDGLFRTKVVLNNRLVASGLIDTGANSVLLCQHMADELGLPRGTQVELETLATPLVGYYTVLTSLRLGAIDVHDVGAVVVSLGPACEEVIIGLSVLRKLRSVTLSRNTLKLIGPPRRP
jgi:clan AA aspartic protease (TIGR02281 family)